MKYLPYDPGSLPTQPPPNPGDVIEFEVTGYPPYKDESFLIRNPKHKDYTRFVALRKAGITAMNGRAWSHAPIQMDFIFYAPQLEEKKELLDYVAGIEDTLDGSSGCHFTYLPIIFEDDCQICTGHNRFAKSNEIKYYLRFKIMEGVQPLHQPDAE
jgi:hypothetical protein